MISTSMMKRMMTSMRYVNRVTNASMNAYVIHAINAVLPIALAFIAMIAVKKALKYYVIQLMDIARCAI